MKYMVMECHFSYAIVLDESGRFRKVANLHYETGQVVTDIVEMQEPDSMISAMDATEVEGNAVNRRDTSTRRKSRSWRAGLATLAAACLLLMITALYRTGQSPYASVYVTINPQLRIDVNRSNVVVGLDGLNEDGRVLIEGYSYKKKELSPVMDELMDRAIEMGYLTSGRQITLTLDGEDDTWVVSTEEELTSHLNDYLADKVSVTIYVGESTVDDEPGDSKVPETDIDATEVIGQEIVIPITPDHSDSNYGISDYGETTTEPSKVPTTESSTDASSSEGPAIQPPAPEAPTAFDSNYGDSSYQESVPPTEDDQTDYGQDNNDYGNHDDVDDSGDDNDDSCNDTDDSDDSDDDDDNDSHDGEDD